MNLIDTLTHNSYTTEEIIDQFHNEENADVEWIPLDFAIRHILKVSDSIKNKIGCD